MILLVNKRAQIKNIFIVERRLGILGHPPPPVFKSTHPHPKYSPPSPLTPLISHSLSKSSLSPSVSQCIPQPLIYSLYMIPPPDPPPPHPPAFITSFSSEENRSVNSTDCSINQHWWPFCSEFICMETFPHRLRKAEIFFPARPVLLQHPWSAVYKRTEYRFHFKVCDRRAFSADDCGEKVWSSGEPLFKTTVKDWSPRW